MSRVPSDSGMSATARRSSAARAMISSAVRTRASQVAAAAQPSSIKMASGECVCVAASGGCHNGPAAATMMMAASVSRSSVSHHGVRAGVSSFGAISSRSRVGGKSMRRGRGGIIRNSHHKTGNVSNPISTSGSAKPMRQAGNHDAALASAVVWACGSPSVAAPIRACSASKSSLAGRSVRWMVKLQPSRSVSARISSR